MEELFGRKELTDKANNLRVYFFRLKKLLLEAGMPDHDYVICRNGTYYWNSPVETILDVEVFKELVNMSQNETDLDEKLELLRRACQIYRGEFLENLSGEEWVIIESVQCKGLYTSVLQELCRILMERKDYEAVLQAVEPACEMYPFDDWQTVKMECYIALGQYEEALKEYEATTKYLLEELGVPPTEKMLVQLGKLSEHMGVRSLMFTEIKDELREETEEKGAFYCDYQGFRDVYRVLRRGMERNGQSVFLVLCTLTDTKGNPMESSERLDQMADRLHMALQFSLRRCDSFTQYSSSQFLVMLVGTNEENCQIAIKRVRDHFAKEHKAWAGHLKCTVSSLMNVTC